MWKEIHTIACAHIHVYTQLLLEKKRSLEASVTFHWPELLKKLCRQMANRLFKLFNLSHRGSQGEIGYKEPLVDNTQCPPQYPCKKCESAEIWHSTPGKEPGRKRQILGMAHPAWHPILCWWSYLSSPMHLLRGKHQFSSVQSLSHVRLFATPWIAAHQASLSITNSWSSLTLTSIQSVMPSSHLILCRPLLLLPPIPPSIRVFFQWVNSSHEVAKVLEFQL